MHMCSWRKTFDRRACKVACKNIIYNNRFPLPIHIAIITVYWNSSRLLISLRWDGAYIQKYFFVEDKGLLVLYIIQTQLKKKLMKLLSGIFCRKCVHSLHHLMQRVFSLPHSISVILRIFILLIIIKSEVWLISDCLWSGREIMLWAVWLDKLLWFRMAYSISQEICTRFCCALLCCGYAIVHNEFTWSIYPYSSGLLCWHWGNR